MRLFVALDPPADALAHLTTAIAPVRSATPSLRWADVAQWHLTLTFCGEVADKPAAELAERLARAGRRHPPLSLRMVGAGAFPRRSRAGVLWCGLAGDIDGLTRLAASTAAAARRSGIDVEGRRYRPHLTIARVSPAVDLGETVDALASYAGPPWTASEIHLVHSHLGRPTVHERIHTWPLGGAYQA